MKKIQLNSFDDLKKLMAILEKHSIEFSWDMFDNRNELHLGHVNVDHVKQALENCHIQYKIADY